MNLKNNDIFEHNRWRYDSIAAFSQQMVLRTFEKCLPFVRLGAYTRLYEFVDC